ncbi:MAG: hypothetical protein EBY38_08695 [Flavobacteriaceae bacterium]|jgi:hypothetical protein|nr:hypothetical protein [Flavobacteriaceae bacterium]
MGETMRLFSGLFILIASSAMAENETFICQANGFRTQPQITVHHDNTNDLLQFDIGFSFAGQNNPKTPIAERGAESLWFKAKIKGDAIKTTYNVYLYDTWILIETIELPVLEEPCTPMTCEEQQTIYRLKPCTLAD